MAHGVGMIACLSNQQCQSTVGNGIPNELVFLQSSSRGNCPADGVYDGASDVGCCRPGRVDDGAAARQGIQAGHQRTVKSD